MKGVNPERQIILSGLCGMTFGILAAFGPAPSVTYGHYSHVSESLRYTCMGYSLPLLPVRPHMIGGAKNYEVEITPGIWRAQNERYPSWPEQKPCY